MDSFRDIAANKLAALLDRFEPKDFVDLYFILQKTTLENVRGAWFDLTRWKIDVLAEDENVIYIIRPVCFFLINCYYCYMANTITIPKTEYKHLKQAAERYETIREALVPSIVPEFPEESFEDYENPKRLKASYTRALKEFKNGYTSSTL